MRTENASVESRNLELLAQVKQQKAEIERLNDQLNQYGFEEDLENQVSVNDLQLKMGKITTSIHAFKSGVIDQIQIIVNIKQNLITNVIKILNMIRNNKNIMNDLTDNNERMLKQEFIELS